MATIQNKHLCYFLLSLTIGARMRPSNKSSLKQTRKTNLSQTKRSDKQAYYDREQVILFKVSIELFLVSEEEKKKKRNFMYKNLNIQEFANVLIFISFKNIERLTCLSSLNIFFKKLIWKQNQRRTLETVNLDYMAQGTCMFVSLN